MKTKRLIDFFCRSVKIPSPSFLETHFLNYLKAVFEDMGGKTIIDKSGLGSNLIVRFDGNPDKKGVVLAAHLDTVEDGVDIIEPALDGSMIWSNGPTILGADNKATIAMYVEAMSSILEEKVDFCPVDFLFTFGEEKHLAGARALDTSLLRFRNLILMDASGRVGGIVLSSPTHYSFDIQVFGEKAHAGIEPEKGINAIVLAAEIIKELPQGRIDPYTTFNIGIIEGGEATNIVPDKVKIKGEFRGLYSESITRIIDQLMQLNFKKESVEVELKKDYTGYKMDPNHFLVKRITELMVSQNIQPYFLESGGGSDANILRERGFETINLTSGMMKPHSTEEYIEINDLIAGTELVIEILKQGI